MQPKILNLTDTATYLGIPRRTVTHQLRNDRFPIRPLPGTKPRMWAIADLDAWLASARDGE